MRALAISSNGAASARPVYQAAKDVTAQTRSLVADNERALTYQVSTLFVNVQLAESTIDLAQQDLKSFQQTVDISEYQFKAGGISENDYLMIEVQLLQFQMDLESAQLARAQGLSDLRQQLGYESVSADYDVVDAFDYLPMKGNLEDLQMQALQSRPDLRAAVQGVTAANSGYVLAKADGKPDVTVQANYTRNGGLNDMSFFASIPLPIFNRNQGEIARTRSVITQMQEQQAFTNGQVLTDVKDAFEGLKSNERVVLLYRNKYRDVAQEVPGHRRLRLPSRRHRLDRFLGRGTHLSRRGTRLPPDARFVLACARAASRSRGRQELAVIRRTATRDKKSVLPCKRLFSNVRRDESRDASIEE